MQSINEIYQQYVQTVFKYLMTLTQETFYQAVKSIDRIGIMKMLHDCLEPYREIIYMRLFGNLSFREIGDVFDKTENWARVSFTVEKNA